jgi:multidrug efflux system membrane fusion protein
MDRRSIRSDRASGDATMASRAGAAGLSLLAVIAVAAVPLGHAAAQQPAAVPVIAAAATRQDVPVMLQAIGTVQAFQSVLVRARVDGTLDSVAFIEGQDVKAGELLAQIDPRPYQATLDQALAKRASDQAQLTNARLDLQRYADLMKSQFASRQSVDTQNALVAQYQANLEGDDAAIEAARLNLGFTHITSPINGRVGLRLVDPGNLIHASDAGGIVTVAEIHPISVVFTLPQDALPDVQTAMHQRKLPVYAFSGDDRTQLSSGELLTVNNTIDQSTGTFSLKATFANLDDKLWPGQFINAHLKLDTLAGATTVPTPAIQHGPNGLFVYLIKPDSTVAAQPVDVRQDDGHVAVITKGLAVGQNVVVNGQSRLQNGSRVSVTPAAAS